MIKVSECNGFEIREKEDHEMGLFSDKRYVVGIPHYDGVWIDDFDSITAAESFCNEEDAEDWEKAIQDSLTNYM